MTVGQLARRTGLTHKAIREYEGLGLIYSAGRSEAGYRLFDDSALWCAEVIGRLRSVGLTLKEIEQLAEVHAAGDETRLEQRLAGLLAASERRIDARISELEATRARIRAYALSRSA